ncbi:MAG: hypothetical protein AAGG01_19320 [Planctomycetota bacterium]
MAVDPASGEPTIGTAAPPRFEIVLDLKSESMGDFHRLSGEGTRAMVEKAGSLLWGDDRRGFERFMEVEALGVDIPLRPTIGHPDPDMVIKMATVAVQGYNRIAAEERLPLRFLDSWSSLVVGFISGYASDSIVGPMYGLTGGLTDDGDEWGEEGSVISEVVHTCVKYVWVVDPDNPDGGYFVARYNFTLIPDSDPPTPGEGLLPPAMVKTPPPEALDYNAFSNESYEGVFEGLPIKGLYQLIVQVPVDGGYTP